MNNNLISKFEVEGKVLYGKTLWKPNEHDLFHLHLYDGATVWSGRFSNEFANKYRDRVDISEEEYLQVIKTLFSSQCSSYSYDFKPVQGDNNSYNFRWYKRFEDALVVYGCVPVHHDDCADSKDSLIDLLLLENQNLLNTVSKISKRNELISEDLEKCKYDLEKFVNIKSSLEESLYGKFVQLLNSKKRRIKLLEENLHRLEEPLENAQDLD